jgi:hypothetical protein
VACNDFDTGLSGSIVEWDNQIFGEEQSIETQAQLYPTITQWDGCCQIFKLLEDPVVEHVPG